MSVRFRSIILPLELIKHEKFAKGIEQSNTNVFETVEYLKKFIESNHEILRDNTKEINKLIFATLKKLTHPSKEHQSFSEFLNNLQELNQSIESQLNKNFIFLNSRRTDTTKRTKEFIKEKLEKANESVVEFVTMARDYNKLGERYLSKCEYFSDIGHNPVKYYAFSKNQLKFQKILQIEEQLEIMLEGMEGLKRKIKTMMTELGIKISEFYEGIRVKVEDFRKVFQIVLQRVYDQIVNVNKFSKIEEASEGAEESEAVTKRTDKGNENKVFSRDSGQEPSDIKKYLKQLRKEEISKNEMRNELESILMNFITNYLYEINIAINSLEALENNKEHLWFENEKKIVDELLPPRCLQDIDIILEESKIIKNIFTGIEKIVAKDVIEEILKRQKIYFNRFMEEIDHFCDSKTDNKDPETLVRQIEEKVRKYREEENEWIRELDSKFKETMNRIRNEFKNRLSNRKEVIRTAKKSDLFDRPFFLVLKIPYFEHNHHLEPFHRSENIIKYEEIIKSDRIKKIVFDLESDPINGEGKKEVKKSKSTCCGLRRVQKQNPGKDFLEKIKKTKEIDSFYCALKDGYMLYQGSITIYPDYLRFHSFFNPSTFFGSMDIFIPKFDIYEFIKGRHIMSLLITVITKRGNVELTSFFTDPTEILIETYNSNNKNTEYDNATCNYGEDQEKKELEELRDRMENDFVNMAFDAGFRIVKVTPIQSEKELSLEYTYFDSQKKESQSQENLVKKPLFFRMKIKCHEGSIEYLFSHSQSQSLEKKQILEEIAKEVVSLERGRKAAVGAAPPQNPQAFPSNISFSIGEELSIIGEKEKHTFDIGTQGAQGGVHERGRETSFFSNLGSGSNVSMKKNQKNGSGMFASTQVLKNWIDQNRKENAHNQFGENKSLISHHSYSDASEKNVETVGENKMVSTMDPISVKRDNETRNVLMTNSHLKKLSEHSSVSSNASTVKFGRRDSKNVQIERKKKHNRSRESDRSREEKEEGMNNVFMMIGIALLLIMVLKMFS